MNKADQAVMFSSASTEYGTEERIWRPVVEKLGLTWDMAASHELHVLPHYATVDGLWTKHFSTPSKSREFGDGLTATWQGKRVWCNPPYGRGVTEQWVKKAAMETAYWGTDYGSELVTQARCPIAALLLPGRTETEWFQRWVAPNALVYFIQGRLHFVGADSSAPFPSVLAVYDGRRIKPGHMDTRLWDPRSEPEFPYEGPDLRKLPTTHSYVSDAQKNQYTYDARLGVIPVGPGGPDRYYSDNSLA